MCCNPSAGRNRRSLAGRGILPVLLLFPLSGTVGFARHHRRLALSRRLVGDTGVAVLPGEAFGRPAEELSVRIAYVDFNGLKALTARETIPIDQHLPDDFVDCWRKTVVTAMELNVNWLWSTDSFRKTLDRLTNSTANGHWRSVSCRLTAITKK